MEERGAAASAHGPVSFGPSLTPVTGPTPTMGPHVVGTAALNLGLPYPGHVHANLQQNAYGQQAGHDPLQASDPWGGFRFAGAAPAATGLPVPGPANYGIGTPGGAATPGIQTREYDLRRPIFEEKVAIDPHFRYDEKHKEEWLKTVKNYLVGKAYEMEAMLDWAEGFQLHPISPADVAGCDSAPIMTNIAATRLDRELWSFLNLNLTGDAKMTFDNLPRLQGFEAWRKVVVPMGPRTLSRLMTLYSEVRNPPRAKNLDSVAGAFDAWEAKLRVYQRCGGHPPPEHEQVLIALQMLPLDTPSSMMLAYRSITSYPALKRELEEQVLFLRETRGNHLQPGRPVHVSMLEKQNQEIVEGLVAQETAQNEGDDTQ